MSAWKHSSTLEELDGQSNYIWVSCSETAKEFMGSSLPTSVAFPASMSLIKPLSLGSVDIHVLAEVRLGANVSFNS